MDRNTLADLYDEHGGALFRFLCGFVGNTSDAADVLQSAFAKLADNGAESVSNPRAYLWTAARNEARNLRYRRRAPFLVPRTDLPSSSEDRETVEKALGALPPEQREVVILHVFENMTFDEVGEQLGIPRDTAASRFRYAREKLKEVL